MENPILLSPSFLVKYCVCKERWKGSAFCLGKEVVTFLVSRRDVCPVGRGGGWGEATFVDGCKPPSKIVLQSEGHIIDEASPKVVVLRKKKDYRPGDAAAASLSFILCISSSIGARPRKITAVRIPLVNPVGWSSNNTGDPSAT